MAGRRALPANVHMLRGNPSKLSAAQLSEGLQPEVEIPGCPKHLLPEARKEWRRITPELERYGLVSKLDRSALALYCQAWARLVWAEEQMARAMGIAAEKRAEAEAKGEEYLGGDGMTYPTASGAIQYSPHWVIANRAAEQVKNFLGEFGLSPATRTKVSTSAVRQRALDFDDDDSGDEAGYGGL